MITEKRKFGDLGEQIAAKYLKNKGYIIIETNYQRPWGEIDIVAKRYDNLIIFIEVKTRKKSNFPVLPEENVNYWKLKRLKKAIQTYLIDKKIDINQEWQFDVIGIEIGVSVSDIDIRHTENVVLV